MREIVAIDVLHSTVGGSDKIWCAAVVRIIGEGVPMLVTFHGGRGSTMNVQSAKTRDDLGKGVTIAYGDLRAAKRKKGYEAIDPEDLYYGVAAAIEAVRNGQTGPIKNAGPTGSKPIVVHAFSFGGVELNGEHLCRKCGKRENTAAHGYKAPMPKPTAVPMATKAEAPARATPVPAGTPPILRRGRKIDF